MEKIIRFKNFSKKEKKREAYGNIDEQAPKDPYYHDLLKKAGAGAAIGGTGSVALGSLLTNKEGREALERVSELNGDIRTSKFFMKDHFGDSGSGDWLDEQLKKDQAKHGKKIEGHKKEIEEIIKKSGKKMRRHALGSGLVAAGTGAAVLGTGVYLGAKFGDNARRAGKKDMKDVLVQAHKEYSDTEEKVYSVLMTEEELALFSEIQKEFARRDYEGLTQAEADALRKNRSGYARALKQNYRQTMSDIDRVHNPGTYELTSNGMYRGGGVKSTYKVTSTKGSDLNPSQFKRFHKNSTINQLLKNSGEAKAIMRSDVQRIMRRI
jgi:uncharacterized protein YnzC (UPF0291/DUF896 family)